MPKRSILRSGAWFTLFIFATGVALGYAFAVQGGGRYLSRLVGTVGKVPTPHLQLSQPAVTLGLMVLVAVGILWAARRR